MNRHYILKEKESERVPFFIEYFYEIRYINPMGYVYLIYDDNNDSYKIGVTRKKDSKRIKQLQTGNSCELQILYMHNTPYPFRLETMLHNYYTNSLVHGEWYKDVGIDEFKDRCKEFDSHIIALKDNPFFSKNLR